MYRLLIYFRPETSPGRTDRNLNLSSSMGQTGSRVWGPIQSHGREAAGWREPTQKPSSQSDTWSLIDSPHVIPLPGTGPHVCHVSAGAGPHVCHASARAGPPHFLSLDTCYFSLKKLHKHHFNFFMINPKWFDRCHTRVFLSCACVKAFTTWQVMDLLSL